jgi:acetolactate synthase-1/2/3 large subunit
MNVAEAICAQLRQLEVGPVFGLPGTQNLGLFEAMRRSDLRSVAATDEAAAAFMATGYARSTGRVGVLTTIPGPGFAYALAGVAEARHDSTALLWLTLRSETTGQAFPLQRLDQAAMAAPVVKRCIYIDRPESVLDSLAEAYREALADEPGPVLVEVASAALMAPVRPYPPRSSGTDRTVSPPPALLERARAARRPVLFVGQGAQGAASDIRALARSWRVPVLCTCSGRGVLPDSDPLAFVSDFSFGLRQVLPEFLGLSDLILALGCKFSHNGSAAGRLSLPKERLVRIDTSDSVLRANYPASLSVCAGAEGAAGMLLNAGLAASDWTEGELQAWRSRFDVERLSPIEHEPAVANRQRTPIKEVFQAVGDAFGSDAIYVTDAGLHQALTRRYAQVTATRGLLCPSDFQSMGFGLSGAIGAALGRPDATVVACIGDGALLLSLGELSTAVREGVNLVIVLFNDGAYGLIRRQQLMTYGRATGTALGRVDYAALASALGFLHVRMTADPRVALEAVTGVRGVRMVELPLAEAGTLGAAGVRSAAKEALVRAVPGGAVRALKRALGRR